VWSGEESYGSKTGAYINLVRYPDKAQEQTPYVRQILAGHPDAFHEHTLFACQLTGHPDAVQHVCTTRVAFSKRLD
jgi:hypothetical protein